MIPADRYLRDLYYPRDEPALKRIQEPMPFPANDLIDTLTYTASFVDQAGYLASYAKSVRTQYTKRSVIRHS